MLELVGAAALGCVCWSALKWLGGVVARATVRSVDRDVEWRRRVGAPQACNDCGSIKTPLSALGRCWECYGKSVGYFDNSKCLHRLAGVGQCSKTAGHDDLHGDGVSTWSDEGYYWLDNEVVYDTAGNVHFKPTHRVAQPVEVAANRLSPLGFVAMSLRLSDKAAARLSAEHYKQVVAVVEVAADRLSSELVGCADCGGFGGVHTAACSAWGDMLAMDSDEMLGRHEEDPKYE